MTPAVAIAVAGALGALVRYGLEGAVGRCAGAGFPWGTFVVNVTGSLAVGFLFTVLVDRGVLEPWARTALLVGFLGAYTTFSTLSLETYRLLEDGAGRASPSRTPSGASERAPAAVYVGVVAGRMVA